MSTRGPWNRVIGKLRNARDWLTEPLERNSRELGDKVRAEFRQAVFNNRYTLAASTIQRKEGEGVPYPTRAWLEHLDLLEDGILDPKIQWRGFGKIQVRIEFSNDEHPSGGVSYNEVARFLEFGTTRQPPRPIIRPFNRTIREGNSVSVAAFLAKVTKDLLTKPL